MTGWELLLAVSEEGLGASLGPGALLGAPRAGTGAFPFPSLTPFFPAFPFLFSLLLPADWKRDEGMNTDLVICYIHHGHHSLEL